MELHVRRLRPRAAGTATPKPRVALTETEDTRVGEFHDKHVMRKYRLKKAAIHKLLVTVSVHGKTVDWAALSAAVEYAVRKELARHNDGDESLYLGARVTLAGSEKFNLE